MQTRSSVCVEDMAQTDVRSGDRLVKQVKRGEADTGTYQIASQDNLVVMRELRSFTRRRQKSGESTLLSSWSGTRAGGDAG
jgi:hypothetical protein